MGEGVADLGEGDGGTSLGEIGGGVPGGVADVDKECGGDARG